MKLTHDNNYMHNLLLRKGKIVAKTSNITKQENQLHSSCHPQFTTTDMLLCVELSTSDPDATGNSNDHSTVCHLF